MSNFPSGLPFYLREQFRNLGSEKFVDTICSEDISKISDSSEVKKRVNRFVTLFIQAANDQKWLKNNLNLSEKLLKKAIEICESVPKYHDRMQSLLSNNLLKFKEVENSKVADDLSMNCGEQTVRGSSKILALQSEFFERMLLGESSFSENQAFRKGNPIELKREKPELVSALISYLNTFTLTLPEKSSIEDLEYLIRVSLEWGVEDSTFPTLEKEMIQRVTLDDASYLYFLSSEYGMQNLSRHCLDIIYRELDDVSAIEFLSYLCEELPPEEREENTPIVNCCLNYCISRLPMILKSLKEEHDMDLKDLTDESKLQEDESGEIKFIRQFQKFIPFLTRLEAPSLHSLNDLELEFVISSLSSKLEVLNLSECSFKKLISLSRFKNLKSLKLSGCKQLLWLDSLKNPESKLEFLDISDCESLKNISAVSSLKNLQRFYFQGCSALSESALYALERFPNLKEMKLRYSEGSPASKILEEIALKNGWISVSKEK